MKKSKNTEPTFGAVPKELEHLSDKEICELALSKLKGRELFPESNRLAREMLKKMKPSSSLNFQVNNRQA